MRKSLKTQIKICGLSTPASIEAAAKHGATHYGLVHFEKSPRHVSLEMAMALRQQAPSHLQCVLLLVNADPQLTQKAIDIVRPDIVQFHGTETPEWLALVHQHSPVKIWKAIGVKDRHALVNADRFDDVVDRLLYDAPAQALPGGTGTRFDWSLLAQFEHRIPWGLAGGLTPENVGDALRATRAPLVDTSSGVESAPGIKDVDKIAAFCQRVRDYQP
jgi:phosphoribosylanthranilate isomerase